MKVPSEEEKKRALGEQVEKELDRAATSETAMKYGGLYKGGDPNEVGRIDRPGRKPIVIRTGSKAHTVWEDERIVVTLEVPKEVDENIQLFPMWVSVAATTVADILTKFEKSQESAGNN